MILGLIKKNVDMYTAMVLLAGEAGEPLEVFLVTNGIRKSEWDAYTKKHKALRVAMTDAKAYAKGVVLGRLNNMLHSKTVNQALAKMYVENMTGWGTDNIVDAPIPNVNIVVNPGTSKGKKSKSNGKGNGSK